MSNFAWDNGFNEALDRVVEAIDNAYDEADREGDDDMYGYIRPDEVAPLPTEPFIDGDGDEWVVIN